ncbi:hypothetical protein [Castellaniella sp.]|uniref:hypothetical protein n=1 Tax=Castellaniella sp. TaxID=1955812 RepID=UPI002AFF9F81|nr:hypothetical protein [Castellaniella sp.]
MIHFTTPEGHCVYANAADIVKIVEAGVSGKWRGIHAHVTLSDGSKFDAQEPAIQIAVAVDNETRGVEER